MAENFFGVTHTGRIRDNNEDTFLAEKLPNGWIVACVIDGVGGYEGGEVAAEIARETIRKSLRGLAADPVQTLKESLLQANSAIYSEKMAGKGNNQMACVLTIALVDIDNNQFYYAHVGDTRLYLLRDQTLVKVTKDHSFVGFLEDSGRLTEKEAMEHPKRNEINKALGFDPQIDVKSDYIETGSSPFLPGDMLLLCSDGLTDLVTNKDMTAVLLSPRSLPEKGEALIAAANNAGGKDNITVVIVSNNKRQVKAKATKPVLVKKAHRQPEVNVVQEPQRTAEPVAQKINAAPIKKSNTLVWILSLLCLLLAAACFWLWSRGTQDGKSAKTSVARTPSESEKKLADSFGLAGDTLSLSKQIFGETITLDTIVTLRQAKLHFNGNGITLQADSSFAGPAFRVTENNRFLSLENVVFKDFAIAILLQSKGVQLKNVQFINCKVPVQRNLLLSSDSAVSGVLKDTFLVSHRSSPK